MNPALITPTEPRALTVLGQLAPRIPTAGRIRAGIKVLTKAAAAHAQAQAIYDAGVAAGRSFDSIEDELVQALPNLRSPLVPKNVPWFTVRGGDFSHPDLARQIMNTYGEDRGDGMRRLYRFPVVFPSDNWQLVMPHELVAHGSQERKFWSEYAKDGTRCCMCYAPVPLNSGGTRAIRVFGGRKAVPREENGGLCEPEACPQYQAKRCNLSGRFVFYIPGISSLSAFELPTTSFYAISLALQKFQTVAFMRGGKISGFLDGKTPFFISKRLMDVPRIDEEGHAVRVQQWIIELEAPLDVTALLRPNDDEALLTQAATARVTLEGSHEPAPPPLGRLTRQVNSAHTAQDVAEVEMSARAKREAFQHDGGHAPRHAQSNRTDAEGAMQTSPPPVVTASRRPRSTPTATETTAASAQAGPTVGDVVQAAAQAGLSGQDYERYADKCWGVGWRLNAVGRKRALDEIARLAAEPGALAAKVYVELDACSTESARIAQAR